MLTLKLVLEAAIALLAAARATEQVASLRNDVAERSKQKHQIAVGSLLAPAASAAAVAYGHLIGVDTILLVASWTNTVVGLFCWTLRRLVRTGKLHAACPASDVTGKQP